ncbi:MAG: D-alanyl-D-alanine carboxypeptidase family protein [Acutalibacteraceae bacterium]|nr:D-alanyl-D-alanine carboxypeptidase family protein [Acutalibacteraceae bacterium]
MMKFLCFFMTFIMIMSLRVGAINEVADTEPLEALPVVAEGEALEIKAKSSILIDANSGKVLIDENSDEKSPPASITKIMSLLLIMEAIEDGRLTLQTNVVCTEAAASLGGSQIWLEPGETMTVHELLKAVTVVSANDATVMLAEAVAGSEESFVVMMNEKAKALGMNNTNFENCTGLDSPNHYSSAFDVALMSKELLKHEKITEYTTIWMDTLRNGESELVNTNKLVRFYEGCTGLKTGTTADAGYCLSASAKRDGLSLIAVVMSGETSKDRFAGAQKLLNYGFAHYKNVEIKAEPQEKIFIDVKKGTEDKIELFTDGIFSSLVKKSDKSEIVSEMILPENVKAPVEEGQQIGEIIYMQNGNQLGSIPLKAAKSVYERTIWRSFAILLKYLCTL